MPDVLSELIRTAFVPSAGKKLIVSDFSAVEARVIAWLAGEQWRMEVFAHGGDIYCASASQMFGVPVEKHGVNGHLRQKGKIAELALGYGGSVGALKAMGALEMGLTEEELPTLVRQWRSANPHITRLWWDVDEAVMTAVRDKTSTYAHGIRFHVQSGMLFIHLPSGRDLCYAKPRIGENQFGSPAVTYTGVGATKKWERVESYGPKFVENIVQGISRDLLCYAMRTLHNHEGYHDLTVYEAFTGIEKERKQEKQVVKQLRASYAVYRPIVYICSPYAGDVKQNVRWAQAYCRFAVQKNCVPIATHLLFPQFMDDTDPAQRQQALFMSRLLLTKCNEVWVFGETISQGMASEIRKAESRNKTIRYFTKDCQEVQASCEN